MGRRCQASCCRPETCASVPENLTPETQYLIPNAMPNEKRPLAGTRILVGRARHQASSLSAGLRSLGASVIEIPFIEIRKPSSFQSARRRAQESQNLRLADSHQRQWRGSDVGTPAEISSHAQDTSKHLQIAAIGPATKQALVKNGLKVKMVPEEYVAESVVKGLRDKVNGKRVLLVRAKVARDVIPKELRAVGAEVDVVEAYETVVPEKSRRAPARFDEGLRPSAAPCNLYQFLDGAKLCRTCWVQPKARAMKNVQLASIGPVTSATLRELGLSPAIEAREFTMGGLIRAIVLARYATLSA